MDKINVLYEPSTHPTHRARSYSFEEAAKYGAVFEKKGKEIINYPRALNGLIKSDNTKKENESPKDAIYNQDRSGSAWCAHLRMLLFQLNFIVSDNIIDRLEFKNRNKFLKHVIILDTTLDNVLELLELNLNLNLIDRYKSIAYERRDENTILIPKGSIASEKKSEKNVSGPSRKEKVRAAVIDAVSSSSETKKVVNLSDFRVHNFEDTRCEKMIVFVQNLVHMKIDVIITHIHSFAEHINNEKIWVVLCRSLEDYIERLNSIIDTMPDALKKRGIDWERLAIILSKFVPEVQFSVSAI